MATAQSDTYPETTAKSRNRTLYRYNVREVERVDEPGGTPRTAYEYDEVWIDGKVTKGKVLAAMRAAALEEDSEDIAVAVEQYQDAKKQLKVTKVKKLSVPEISQIVGLILDVLGIEYGGTA